MRSFKTKTIRKNLVKWGISPTSDCSFCLLPKTLFHVISCYIAYLEQGRYTWRHDHILNFLTMIFQSVRDSIIYVDLPGFTSPTAITGDHLRSDVLLVLPNKCIYILELTVGFESNIRKDSHREHEKYQNLVRQQEHLFSIVKYINLSISTLGVLDQLSLGFLDMLKDLNYNSSARNCILQKISTIAIQSTYYIFCSRNKDWNNSELLVLQLYLSISFLLSFFYILVYVVAFQVKFVNLSISVLGIFGTSSESLLLMLDFHFDETIKQNVMLKTMNISS